MVRKTSDNPISPASPAEWVEATAACPRCKKEVPKTAEHCSFCGYSSRQTAAYDDVDDDEHSAEKLIGSVINDKYRIVSLLGEGGFGVVYKVEFLLFDTCSTFALKLLHPSLSQDPKFRKRFLREAALAMQLIHENTIQIREFGRTADGSLFFTMDYCEGKPLNEVIKQEGFLSVNRALNATRQILSVMEQAHARGIIHRDLKPENVFLERTESKRDLVKVGDFGLAKSYVGGGTDITQGGILGTPRYMSPEQARGSEDLDHRSDIYSIGVILHEMIYGQVPSGDVDQRDSIAPPVHTGHVVPRAVWKIVHKALSPRREDRYQNATEFVDAIETLPTYTPSYLEPRLLEQARGPWWKKTAAGVLLALACALPLSVAGKWLPDELRFGASSTLDEKLALDRNGTSLEGASAASTSTQSEIARYVPLAVGDEFVYEVYAEGNKLQAILTYSVTEELAIEGEFRVRVTTRDPVGGLLEGTERFLTWHLDDAGQVFTQKFVLPDAEQGEPSQEHGEELLRLPGKPFGGEYYSGSTKIHAHPVSLRGGKSECLLVETVEGDQRRLQYYKAEVGLVGLEVFRIETPPGQAVRGGLAEPEKPSDAQESVIFMTDRTNAGTRIFAKYLSRK